MQSCCGVPKALGEIVQLRLVYRLKVCHVDESSVNM